MNFIEIDPSVGSPTLVNAGCVAFIEPVDGPRWRVTFTTGRAAVLTHCEPCAVTVIPSQGQMLLLEPFSLGEEWRWSTTGITGWLSRVGLFSCTTQDVCPITDHFTTAGLESCIVVDADTRRARPARGCGEWSNDLVSQLARSVGVERLELVEPAATPWEGIDSIRARRAA